MQINHPNVVLDLDKGKGDATLDEGDIEAKNLELIFNSLKNNSRSQ